MRPEPLIRPCRVPAVALCTRREVLPSAAGWVYEPKWDGFRAVVIVGDDGSRVWSRHGTDLTARLPELARGGSHLPPGTVVDGELVICGEDGRPDFFALSPRVLGRNRGPEVSLVAFDLLRLGRRDLVALAYAERRRQLLDVLPAEGRWQVTMATRDGQALWQAVLAHDLEGVVAKRADAPYRPGARTRDWVKVKNRRRREVTVGGWAGDAGGELRRLLVGETQDDGRLRYLGTVDIGIGARTARELARRLEPLRWDRSPFAPGGADRVIGRRTWVRPLLTIAISHGPPTGEGLLREAALLGDTLAGALPTSG